MNETFLFRFTPSMMKHEALEAIFVQREDIVQRTLELIRDSSLTESKHHTLFIGPRGIGKTHLVSLIYHRAQAMEDLRERLLIAWLREEEWGVTSLLDLLIRIFRALVAEYNDAGLDERVEALYNLPQGEVEHTAGALLKEYMAGRTLLVLIENLDDVFQGLSTDGQQRLRAYIQENPFFTIVATAQSLFNGVSLQTSPFYGFFRIQHLKGLDIEESTKLLANIARFKGDQELESFIKTPVGRARIRAVNHLAGGNHRVYTIFSQFLTRKSLDDLVEPFMRMLDDLTPYYQDRMRWISPQQRKIVEFLLNHRRPATVKEIAQRCFMTHQTASSQLKTLREMEYVYSVSVGRESYYELREPLMRLCVEVKKNHGEPIRLFIDFLRLWYLPTELEQRLTLLKPEATLEREYLLHALKAIEEDPEDPRVAACIKDFDAYLQSNDFNSALKVSEELVAIRGLAWDWICQSVCLYYLNHREDALTLLNKTVELFPNDVDAWEGRGFLLSELTRYEEALDSWEKAIDLNSQYAPLFFARSWVLLYLGRWNEGIAALDDVLQRFAQGEEPEMGRTSWIISTIFNITTDPATRRTRITDLLEVYDKHQVAAALGPGLVQNISELNSPMISDAAARAWRDTWQELVGDRAEFQLPLRLLDVAVRYRETKDQRVLLELPIEERKLIEPMLNVDEPEQA